MFRRSPRVDLIVEDVLSSLIEQEEEEASNDAEMKIARSLAAAGAVLEMEPEMVFDIVKTLVTSKKSFLMKQLKVGSRASVAKMTLKDLKKNV